MAKSWYAVGGKRAFDFCCAAALLLLLLPFCLALAGLLWLSQNGKIFFVQKRPGLLAKPFDCYKFCTMRDASDPTGKPLSDELRITKIGAALRRLSLDEIPQLVNVLLGEMSLVGPRPLLMEYLPRYSELEKRRHEVRPGITGLAQVRGRNLVSWEQRFKYDVEYVDSLSFGLDLRILAASIAVVFSRQGITTGEGRPMPPFMGQSDSK